MCGIAGIWTTRIETAEARRLVTVMTEVVRHRGPDDDGVDVVSDPGAVEGAPLVVFGHRRLAIIDLSAAGHQPMIDPATGNWITFNGEIYNYRELREDLAGRGHLFRSASDTEVILKAYAEWGVGCWRRLRGIFAFGLWDVQCRELHLVRDHLGIKPLYFAASSQGMIFASEVRPILAVDWVRNRLSLDGLVSYLKYGSVQEPCTMVAEIESLPPGHYLTCGRRGQTSVRHYWRAQECMLRHWARPPAAGDVLGALEDSVRRQLIADVPVGVFLSGGVDSTTVAALAARAQPGSVRTFCIGSEVPELDESNEAAETAAFLGCEHSTLILEGQLVKNRLEAALNSYDQPSQDGINTYFISMLVRQAGIKVGLSGLGGDELFVGYEGFRKGLAVEKAGRLLEWFPAEIRTALSHLLAGASPVGSAVGGALSEMLEPGLAAPYFAGRTLFSRWHTRELLRRELLPGELTGSAWEKREHVLAAQARGMAPVNRVSFFELQTYMLSTLLRDSDQMSMAHGLELRVPLIDPQLVEQVLPIAVEEKMTGGESKRLLHQALAGLLPPQLRSRRKRGFTLPFQQWLLRDLEDRVGPVFLAPHPSGPWEPRVFRKVWEDFRRGRVAWSRVLTLFILENWLRQNKVTI